jgi:hypothetical protein
MADPAFQDRLAAASINVTALSALFSHAVELAITNEARAGSSVIKILRPDFFRPSTTS